MSEINVANEYLDKGMSPKNTEIEKFISKVYHNAKTKEELSLVDKDRFRNMSSIRLK